MKDAISMEIAYAINAYIDGDPGYIANKSADKVLALVLKGLPEKRKALEYQPDRLRVNGFNTAIDTVRSTLESGGEL